MNLGKGGWQGGGGRGWLAGGGGGVGGGAEGAGGEEGLAPWRPASSQSAAHRYLHDKYLRTLFYFIFN